MSIQKRNENCGLILDYVNIYRLRNFYKDLVKRNLKDG